MSKPKILIIGGGIGGLSCATALAETGRFDISIFDSDIIGGQASSKKSKLCNTEISWRIIGSSYTNFAKLIKDIGVIKNLYSVNDNDPCTQLGSFSPTSSWSIINLILQNSNYKQINKILTLFLLSKSRSTESYHNIVASKYFNNNLMNIIIGPYFGLEPEKVTLSAYYKCVFGIFVDNFNYLDKISITKYPTNDSLFEPWKRYLIKKGVRIYEYYAMNDIRTDSNGRIRGVTINDDLYTADEIIFACSLPPLVNIFNNNYYLKNTVINEKLNILKTGQQFYISVNFYWKKPIIHGTNCHIFTFIDGWMPIILKRFINTNYVENNCHNDIKEVWNIGIADKLKGNYLDKFTSQCSFEEIVYEIKMNLIHSPHFNKIGLHEKTWDSLFYGYEFDDRYYTKTPNTEKFSINKGIEKNLLHNQEPELGDNIYFSAYYVKNTVGGASMETSCEIGLKTADLICKKYNILNLRKPIYKTRKYITILTLPFVILDTLLYKFGCKPITDFVSPIVLLVIYFSIICILIYKFGAFLIHNRQLHKCLKKILGNM